MRVLNAPASQIQRRFPKFAVLPLRQKGRTIMAKILDRYLRVHSRMLAGDFDWLTRDNPTSCDSNQVVAKDDNKEKSKDGLFVLKGRNIPRWLNNTNVTEILTIQKLTSLENTRMGLSVNELYADRAVRLGCSILLGCHEVLSADDADAVSLAIPYAPSGDIERCFREPSAIEIAWDIAPNVNQLEFLKEVVLPKQIPVLRKRFPQTLIFLVSNNVTACRFLYDHDWRKFEPEFELILQQEMRGGKFCEKDVWMKAP